MLKTEWDEAGFLRAVMEKSGVDLEGAAALCEQYKSAFIEELLENGVTQAPGIGTFTLQTIQAHARVYRGYEKIVPLKLRINFNVSPLLLARIAGELAKRGAGEHGAGENGGGGQ